MTELQIYVDVQPGKEKELEETFERVFVPAISVQEGFRQVELLRSKNAMSSYQIVLAFASEEFRLKWVASREHEAAFPKICALCLRVAWQGFDILGGKQGRV